MTEGPDSFVDREDATKLIKSGYGLVLSETAANYVTPMLWGLKPARGATPWVNGGTVFFLKCGGQPFAITAGHVFQGYLNRKAENRSLICQVGNLTFDPEKRLIDCNFSEELDIATFSIDEAEVERIGKVIHEHPKGAWPPLPPQRDKGVFLCGFPGSDRSMRNWKELDTESVFLNLLADGVDDRKITCQFHREDWIDYKGQNAEWDGANLAGISGSPLWALVRSESLHYWRLAGIVTQLCESFELLYATRADRIRMDGTLIH